MNHHISTKWQGDMHFIADAPGGKINLDAAEDVGGQGKGNRAKPLMLTAIAGCTGMDVALMIKKMRLEVEDFSIDVTGELTEEHPKTYHSVHILYSFKGKNLDEAKLEKAVNLSFDKYCGVIEMFKKFAAVTKEIRFN
jgi:putative redox protein